MKKEKKEVEIISGKWWRREKRSQGWKSRSWLNINWRNFAYLKKQKSTTQGHGNECARWPSFEACKMSTEVNQTHLYVVSKFKPQSETCEMQIPCLTEQQKMRQSVADNPTWVKRTRRIKVDMKSKQAEKLENKEQRQSKHRNGTAQNKRKHRLCAHTLGARVLAEECVEAPRR